MVVMDVVEKLMSKPKCYICDIDGTIADGRHRQHLLPHWGKFFGEMHNDGELPVVEVIRWLQTNPDRPVIFVSGRPEEYRGQTMTWLHEKGIAPGLRADLKMRPTGDYRKDSIVKKEILDKIREDWDIILAFDDRQDVVNMWRENGVFCLQAPDQTVMPHAIAHKPIKEGESLLTLMVGPSGGGKSTYARKNFHPSRILESDQFRIDIVGSKEDQSKNNEVFESLHAVASVRLSRGLPVVIDATHLKRKDRLTAASLAPAGSGVRYVVVDRPLKDKLANPEWRPEWLIRKHDHDFKSQLSEILEGDLLPNVVVITEFPHGTL